MSDSQSQTLAPQRGWKLSLDGWAVLLAFAAALAVRLGVLKHIPW